MGLALRIHFPLMGCRSAASGTSTSAGRAACTARAALARIPPFNNIPYSPQPRRPAGAAATTERLRVAAARANGGLIL
jgi:hypothetical protein